MRRGSARRRRGHGRVRPCHIPRSPRQSVAYQRSPAPPSRCTARSRSLESPVKPDPKRRRVGIRSRAAHRRLLPVLSPFGYQRVDTQIRDACACSDKASSLLEERSVTVRDLIHGRMLDLVDPCRSRSTILTSLTNTAFRLNHHETDSVHAAHALAWDWCALTAPLYARVG
jgi:hypothetical protein